MKALFIGAILLTSPLRAQPGGTCSVADCSGNFMPPPVPPTSAGRNKVRVALANAVAAKAIEDAAARKLDERLNIIRFEVESHWKFRFIGGAKEAVRAAALSDPEYLTRQKALRVATNETYKAHNAAIGEAMTAYGLTPPVTDFTGDPRAASVNMAAVPWLPHYSRHEIRDKSGQWAKRDVKDLNTEAAENANFGGGVMAARTRGNGVIELYSQAFLSPDELAINIYHETSHWVDTAGKSGGFKDSDLPEVSFRTEQHAYERSAAFAVQINANAQTHRDLANQFKIQAEISEKEHLTKAQILTDPRFRQWIGKRWVGSLALTPAEPDISQGDEALLQNSIAEAQAKARARAREQLEIADRDHDERLNNTYVELASRSCADPGSVAQYELDSLPKPRGAANIARPAGLSGCRETVYIMLTIGATAEDLAEYSTPKVPLNARPDGPGVPDARVTFTSFRANLRFLKQHAVAACSTDLQVPLNTDITHPRPPFQFEADDHLYVDKLAVGLGKCEEQLFRWIVEVIRSGRGHVLSAQWVQDTAAKYRTIPHPAPGYIVPPARPQQPPPVRDPCRENGNIRCP